MPTKIQRWGNSLGIRIPKAFAEQAKVEAGSLVDIAVEDGELVIRPIRSDVYDIGLLVKAINANNLHEAIETGSRRGREIW